MGLLELFSKLVVEHGSAEVQSKHIAMFKDQLVLADKRILELESENAVLTSKLENAETTIQQLTKEDEILRRKIQDYEQHAEQPTHTDPLEEIKVKLLCALSLQQHLTLTELASSSNSGRDFVQFHLDELKAKHMVKVIKRYCEPDLWTLIHDGRKYLIENGLLT